MTTRKKQDYATAPCCGGYAAPAPANYGGVSFPNIDAVVPDDHIMREDTTVFIKLSGNWIKLAGHAYPPTGRVRVYPGITKVFNYAPPAPPPPPPNGTGNLTFFSDGTWCAQINDTCDSTMEKNLVAVVWLTYTENGTGVEHHLVEVIDVTVPPCSQIEEA